MSPRLQPFEANSFPLDCGIRLLEASAGTGKTFALAHLVLRLVTEEGLSLRRLLVVTYTDAAAAELRDRIGRRLQEALASLAGPAPDAVSVDPVLQEWLERLAIQAAQPVAHHEAIGIVGYFAQAFDVSVVAGLVDLAG